MDYDPMVMDDAEALGPVVKISQVCLCRNCGCLHAAGLVEASWSKRDYET
jgi:hypothetical protein